MKLSRRVDVQVDSVRTAKLVRRYRILETLEYRCSSKFRIPDHRGACINSVGNSAGLEQALCRHVYFCQNSMGAFDAVCSKDEASATGLTTFSVTVHLSQNGKIAKTITNNVIKQIKTSDTWEDLFWDVVDDRPDSDLPSDIEDIFQKAVSVCVSPSSSGERYHPGDTTEMISILHNFDPKLKYVLFIIDVTKSQPKPETNLGKDAFKMMMAAQGAKIAQSRQFMALRQ